MALKTRFHMGKGSAIHNSRNFDLEKAEHINPDLQEKNKILYGPLFRKINANFNQKNFNDIRKHELELYQALFEKSIQSQNDRNISARHPERNKTIEDYYSDRSPTETILSVGNLQDGYVEGADLLKIYMDYYKKFNAKFGNNIRMIDISLHCDEQGADHIHERLVFCGKNSHGELIASKSAAFKALGIQRPDISKPESRNNCALQTFTKMCRDLFIETCIEYGIKIDQEVREYSKKSGLSSLEYKIHQEQKKRDDLQNLNDKIIEQIADIASNSDLYNDLLQRNILAGNYQNVKDLQNAIRDAQEAQEVLDYVQGYNIPDYEIDR